MKVSKSIIISHILLLLLLGFFMTSCCLLPTPTKSVIKGRVLIPLEAKISSRDVSGWVPAVNTMVSLIDADDVTQTVHSDEYGYFSFINIAVKPNTVITAMGKVNGKTILLKKTIFIAVQLGKDYDVGTLTPESTALALVVERLLDKGDKGTDINSDKLKESTYFDELVKQVQEALEEIDNITENYIIDSLIQDIVDEFLKEEEEEANLPTAPMPASPIPVPVSIINIATEPADVSGLDNSQEITATLSTATAGAIIYYTLNGDIFTTDSAEYTIPLTISTSRPEGETIILRAMGIKKGYAHSAVTTIEIEFKPKIYTLTYQTNGPGSITGNTSQKVEYRGDGIAIEAVPDEDYYFVKWSDGSKDNPRKDRKVIDDITVEAIFEEITVIGIVVKNQPINLKYAEGQLIELDGLEVTLVYNDGSKEDVVFTDFGTEGITVSPDDGTELAIADDGKSIVITHAGSGEIVNTDNLTVSARALIIEADSENHQVIITSNYGDVVKGSTSSTITDNKMEGQALGNNLKVKIITDFPWNMTSLILTPEVSTDTVTISGSRYSGQTVPKKTLVVEIRDTTYTTVAKSFTVAVSGSGDGYELTIGAITVLP
jgi:hypothetical protein